MSNQANETHYLDKLHRDLALTLGDAVWSFAKIEWLVYDYIRRLSIDRVDELVGEVAFRPRCSILRKLIERQNSTPLKKDHALNKLDAAEKLSDRRNVIVHNPWQIWIDLNAEEFMTEIQKYSNPNKKVDLKGLMAFTETATQLEQELREALNAL